MSSSLPIGSPAPHQVTDGVGGADRLVGGAGLAVVDDHDPPAGEPAGEGDPSRQSRTDQLPRRRQQVDPTVARTPGLRGRVEAAHHLGHRSQWPLADRVGLTGGAGRRRHTLGEGDHEPESEEQDG